MKEEKNADIEAIQKEIELRSPIVQEILGTPPLWIIRWGTSVMFFVIFGLVAGSYFFKYPDVISATITVTLNEQGKISGQIFLPSRGAGKIREGQMVNVKLDCYPYMEFGMLRVQIFNASLLPITIDNVKGFLLEVVFPEKLITNYGKELSVIPVMTGSAEIITEDIRLLDKFLNPIRSIIKR